MTALFREHPARRSWLAFALFTLAYFAAVLLGRSLRLESSNIATVWPAAGVAVIWVLRSSRQKRFLIYPLMLLLNAVTSALTGVTLILALTSSIVNSLQTFVITSLLTWWCGRDGLKLRGPRDLGVITLASAIGAALTSTLLIPAEIATGLDEPLYWTLGLAMRNLTGVVITTALIHLCFQQELGEQVNSDLRRRDLLPMLASLAAAIVLFGRYDLAVAFTVLPVFLWIALRFSTVFTLAAAALTVTSMAVLTLVGNGPFGHFAPSMRLFAVQSASLVLAGFAGTLSLFRDETGALVRRVEAAHAKTQETATRLADSEKVFRLLFTGAPVGIITTTTPGHGPIMIKDANETMEAMIGLDSGLVGEPISRLVKRADVVEFVATARAAALSGETLHVDVTMNTAQGEVIARLSLTRVELELGEPFLVVTAADVTGAHNEREQLTFIAQHDHLTGLANRSHFDARLTELAADPMRRGSLGLLYLDLDGFKQVNDTGGHSAGDEVLQETGRRLLRGVRGSELVARLGGDEFAVIAPNSNDSGLRSLGARLSKELSEPIDTSNGTFTVGVSIGTAILAPNEKLGDFIHRVDALMYQVKLAGKVDRSRRR